MSAGSLLILLFTILTFLQPSNAGQISPEAKAFLAKLHQKVAGIETLTWQVSRPSFTTHFFYKKPGRFKVISQTTSGGQYITIIRPDGFFGYSETMDVKTLGNLMLAQRVFPSLWFMIPLVPEEFLSQIGKVTVRIEDVDGQPHTLLEIAVHSKPRSSFQADGSILFYFEKESLSLTQWTMGVNQAAAEPSRAKSFTKIAGYEFPSSSVEPGYQGWNSDRPTQKIELNKEIADEVFKVETAATLTHHPEKSIAELGKILAKAATSLEKASIHYSLGKLLDKKSQTRQKALEEFKMVVELQPQSPGGYWALVTANQNFRKVDDAEAVMKDALGKFPERASMIYLRLVSLFLHSGSQYYARALPWAQTWAEKSPDDYRAHVNLGRALDKNRNYQGAAQAYEKALAMEGIPAPLRIPSQLSLAVLYPRIGRRAEAEKLLKSVLDAPAAHVTPISRNLARTRLYGLYLSAGRLEKILAENQQALQVKPDDLKTLEILYTIYKAKNDHLKAFVTLGKIIEIDPHKAVAYQNDLFSFSHTSSRPVALKQIAVQEKLMTRDPKSIGRVLSPTLQLCRQIGQQARAQQILENLLAKLPNNAYLLAQSADQFQSRNPKKAIELYEKAVVAEPSKSRADNYRLSLARVYQSTGRNDKAAELAGELLKPETSENIRSKARLIRVSSLRALGKLHTFIGELEKEHAANPNDKPTMTALASAYSSGRKYSQAADIYAELVKLEPSENHYINYFNYLSNARRYKEQIGVLETFFKKYPNRRQNYLSSLVYAYRNSGRVIDAINISREYAENYKGGQGYGQLGDLLRQAGKFDDAVAAYQEAVAKAIKNEDTWQFRMNMASIYQQQKKYEEAEAILKKLVNESKQQYQRDQANRTLLNILRATGKVVPLIKSLEKKVASNPADKVSLKQLAELYRSQNSHTKAAGHYRKLIKLEPTTQNYLNFIDALQNGQRHEELIAVYREFFKKYPNERQSKFSWMINAYQQSGKFEEGIKEAREYAKTARQPDVAFSQLANLLRQAKKYEEAAVAYQKVIEVTRNVHTRWSSRLALAGVYRDQKKFKEALEIAKALTKTADQSRLQQVGQLVAELMEKTGRLDEWLKKLEAHAKKDPKAEAPLLQLAQHYYGKRNYAQAADAYRKLLKISPNNTNYISNTINNYSRGSHHAELAEFLEAFLKEHTEHKRSYMNNLVHAYQNSNQRDKALKASKAYADAVTNTGYPMSQYASYLQQAGRKSEAVKAYREAIRRENNNNIQQWKLSIASLQRELGKVKEAEAVARDVMKNASNDSYREQAGQTLMQILRVAGRAGEWLKELEQQVTKNPKDVQQLKQLANAYTGNNQHDKAAETWKKVVQLDRNRNQYMKWINSLQRSNKPKRLIEAYKELFKNHPDQKRNYMSGLISTYRNMRDYDGAIEAAREYAKIYNQNGSGDAQVAGILQQAQRYEEAIASYRKAIKADTRKSNIYSWQSNIISIYQQMGKDEEAEKAIIKWLPTLKNSSQIQAAQTMLVNILRKSGREQEFLKTIEDQLKKKPKDSKLLNQLASTYRALGNYVQAEKTFRKLLDSAPNAQNYQNYIYCLQNQSKHKDVVVAYEEMFKKFPNQKQSQMYNLMSACQRAGMIAELVRYGKEYVELQQSYSAAEQCARLLKSCRKFDEAIAAYELAVKRSGSSVSNQWRFKMEIAQIYRDLKKSEEALALARELAKIATNDSYRRRANEFLISVLKTSGGIEDFIKDLKAGLEKNPKDKQNLQLLADTYRMKGKNREAAETYRKLIAIDSSLNNYNQWVSSLSNAQMNRERIAALEELFKKYPDQKLNRRRDLMWAYFSDGQQEKAIAIGKEYARSNPLNGSSSSELAGLYSAMNRTAEAVAAYDEAVKQSNNTSQKWNWMLQATQLLYSSKKYRQAERRARKLLESGASSHYQNQARALLTNLREQSGSAEDLQKEAEERLKTNPKDTEALNDLIEVYRQKHDVAKVDGLYRRLISIENDFVHYRSWIFALSNAERYKEAAAICDEYMKKFPARRRFFLPQLTQIYTYATEKEKAIKAGQEFVRSTPLQAHTRGNFADHLRQLEEFDRAIKMYKEAIDLTRDGRWKWNWKYKIGLCYRDKGDKQNVELIMAELIKTARNARDRGKTEELVKGLD